MTMGEAGNASSHETPSKSAQCTPSPKKQTGFWARGVSQDRASFETTCRGRLVSPRVPGLLCAGLVVHRGLEVRTPATVWAPHAEIATRIPLS